MNTWLVRTRATVLPIAGVVALVLVWEFVTRLLEVPTYILPRPSDLASEIAAERQRLTDALSTLLSDSLLGFIGGNLLGAALALVLIRQPALRAILLPAAVGLQSVPIIAVAPLITLVFGYGGVSTFILIAMISFVPMFLSLLKGWSEIGTEKIDLLQMMGASKWQVLKKVHFPASIPFAFAALRISGPGAISSAIVVEYLSGRNGVGSELLIAAAQRDNVYLWSIVVLTTLCVVLAFALVVSVESFVESRLGFKVRQSVLG